MVIESSFACVGQAPQEYMVSLGTEHGFVREIWGYALCSETPVCLLVFCAPTRFSTLRTSFGPPSPSGDTNIPLLSYGSQLRGVATRLAQLYAMQAGMGEWVGPIWELPLCLCVQILCKGTHIRACEMTW